MQVGSSAYRHARLVASLKQRHHFAIFLTHMPSFRRLTSRARPLVKIRVANGGYLTEKILKVWIRL